MRTQEEICTDAVAFLDALIHREGRLDLAFKTWIEANYFGRAQLPEAMTLLTVALLKYIEAAEATHDCAIRALARFIAAQSGCNLAESTTRARDMVREMAEEMMAEERAAMPSGPIQ